MRRFVTRFSIFLVIVYAGLCCAMFLVQRSLIYYPVKQSHRLDANAVVLKINGEEIVVAQSRPQKKEWWDAQVSTIESSSASLGTTAVVYFGGNSEDVSQSLTPLKSAFPNSTIYAMHYRSYGGSTGEASQEHLFADALTFIDNLRPRYQRLVVMGRSLGSGIAVYAASQRSVEGVILVTPYYSLEQVAAAQYPYLPATLLLLDKYPSYRFAPSVKAPVYMLVAEWDQLTPMQGSVDLQKCFASGQAKMIVVKQAWHNGISNKPEYQEELRKLWQSLSLNFAA